MAETLRKKGKKYIVTFHQGGNRTQRTFSVKRDAERAMNLANRELKKGLKIPSKKHTLNYFIDRWFKLVVCNKEAPLAQGTYVRYKGIYENKIRDGIGKKDVSELTRVVLMNYFEDLQIDGHSRPDIEGRLCVINGGLTKGADSGHGLGPHAGLIKSLYPSKKKKKVIDTFTPREERLILENTHFDFYPATLVLFRTGMRLGEALGLDFSAINFNDRYLVVRQSFRNGLLSGTKTGVERIVPFGNYVNVMLQEAKTQRNLNRLRGKDSEAVFVRNGKRIDQGRSGTHGADVLNEQAIDYRKPHTTRHTVATRLLDAGHPTKLVAELLGHTVQTLLSTYSHDSKDKEDQKREMLLGLNVAPEDETR